MNKKWKMFENASWVIKNINHDFVNQKTTIVFSIIVDSMVMGEEERVIRKTSIRPEIMLPNYGEIESTYLADNADNIKKVSEQIFQEKLKGNENASENTKAKLKQDADVEAEKSAKIFIYNKTKTDIFSEANKEIVSCQYIANLCRLIEIELRRKG